MSRKIIQIAACSTDNNQSTQCNSYIFALCHDGTLWQQPNNENKWYKLSPISEDVNTEEFNTYFNNL